jgi:hypothetical protein
VYHYPHLNNQLHVRNQLRGSAIFQNIATHYNRLKEMVQVKYPWNKTRFTPNFTGIPPHVSLMAEVQQLKMELQKQKTEIMDELKKELDERNFGGDAYQATRIFDQMRNQHEAMMDRLSGIANTRANRFDSDANRDVLFNSMMNEDENDNENDNENIFIIDRDDDDDDDDGDDGDDSDRNINIRTSPSTTNNNSNHRNGGLMISWNNLRNNGTMALLPKNFVFPRMSFLVMLTNYYCGDRNKNIPPYMFLSTVDFPSKHPGRQQLSMMGKVAKEVVRATRDLANMPNLIKKKGEWNARHVAIMVERIKHFFIDPNNKTRKDKFNVLSWKTIRNDLQKRKWRLYGER